MSYYRFIARDDAARADELGGMLLADDDVALDFGAKIVRDLISEAPSKPVDWYLEVVNGNRAVATIPFKVDATG
jgi:hypothetical protein